MPDTDAEYISVEAIQDGNGGYVRYLFTVFSHLFVWKWQNLCCDSLASLQPQREESLFRVSSDLRSLNVFCYKRADAKSF